MGEIIINNPILKDQKLISKLKVSKDLKKYIKTDLLFIEYDEKITSKESILNIPLTGIVLPFAWLTGNDVKVGKLDRRFKESMDQLQNYFKKMYPKIPFTTEIIAEKLVENQINISNLDRRTGLLFSGGIDSTYSLINNIKLNPNLIMIWGIDNFKYPEHSDHWNKVIETYTKYAKEKNLEINILHTNTCQIFDNRRISHKYHRELLNGSMRAALGHSLVLLPLLAPLSMNRFNHLIIAASISPDYNIELWPYAATLEADEMIRWADVTVQHDGYIKRHEKIMAISEYLKKEKITIRVCLRSLLIDGCLNDNKCEKCLRTIITLVFAGIDPNECGFKVDESTFELVKSKWNKRSVSTFSESWWELQEKIPEVVEEDMYGSKRFFEWFREAKIDETEANWFFTDLYTSLPYSVAKYFDQIYAKLNIQMIKGPWRRE